MVFISGTSCTPYSDSEAHVSPSLRLVFRKRLQFRKYLGEMTGIKRKRSQFPQPGTKSHLQLRIPTSEHNKKGSCNTQPKWTKFLQCSKKIHRGVFNTRVAAGGIIITANLEALSSVRRRRENTAAGVGGAELRIKFSSNQICLSKLIGFMVEPAKGLLLCWMDGCCRVSSPLS